MFDIGMLDANHNIVEVLDVIEWATWFESADRRVMKETIGDIELSTVFLGLNHNYSGEGKPLWFETLIFGGEFDGEMWRYSTYNEAVDGHREIAERLTNGESPHANHT